MAEPDEASETPKTSTLPRSARRCRIPRLNRSSSVRLKSDTLDQSPCRPKSMTLSNRDYAWQLESRYGDMGSVTSVPFSVEDDGSVRSFGSFMSYNSLASQSQCTEASLSRPVSRSHYGKKYILHCDRHLAKQEEYLTPTQRKDREIRQLKSALMKQTKRCEEKEGEIESLKTEIQRLQDAIAEFQEVKHNIMNSSQESDNLDSMMAKNSVSEISFESHETDRSDVQNTITLNNDDSGISNVMSMSPRDSSEFGDLENQKVTTADKAICTDLSLLDISASLNTTEHKNSPNKPVEENPGASDSTELEKSTSPSSPKLSQEFDRFLSTYKQELEQLKSQHREHYQDLKERFNDRVDDLLKKLSEANSRYLELRPLFDRAQDKIENIESQLTEVQKDLESQEDYHNQMYLKMYRKGQEAARFEADEALDFSQHMPKRVSVPDLLRQLQQLELELDQTKQLYREAARGMGDRQAEYTLRFLKDAVFYFLTKKDKEHLKAIQSILGFTDAERMAVAKAMKHRRL